MEKQKDVLEPIGKKYKLDLEEHSYDLQLKKRFAEIQEVCQKYELVLNTDRCYKLMKKIQSKYNNCFNQGIGMTEKKYVEFILNECVCLSLEIPDDKELYRLQPSSKQLVPGWVKEGIFFVYDSTGREIKALYANELEFQEQFWKRYKDQEDLTSLFTSPVMKQYTVKKIFHEKEAKKYLAERLAEPMGEVVNGINSQNNYKKMTKEIGVLVKKMHWLNQEKQPSDLV